jgi:hypothetical protein
VAPISGPHRGLSRGEGWRPGLFVALLGQISGSNPASAARAPAAGGHVNHTYTDHVSILKFIEKNWGLQPITNRSRDNLPDPVTLTADPYVPTNGPAIGDLIDLFTFP